MASALTTYLGKIAADQGMAAAALVSKKLPKTALYVYDAFLTQCAFLCRLSYGSTALLVKAVEEGMERPTDEKNAIIEQLGSDEKYKNEFLVAPPAAKTCSCGYYIAAIGCSAFQYYNTKSLINDSKTLFITFKGVSSVADVTALVKAGAELVDVGEGLTGTVLKIVQTTLEPYKKLLIDYVKTATADAQTGVSQIVITGHSLGGAMAALLGAYIRTGMSKEFDEKKISVHVVSFGAPHFFNDGAKKSFNDLLQYGKFTYDNIINDDDEITKGPKECKHPGLEDVTHIDDVRKQFADIDVIDGIENVPFNGVKRYPILGDIYPAKKKAAAQAGGAKEGESAASPTAAYSNTIIYACKAGVPMCHANYMEINFEGAWTEPVYSGAKVLEYLGTVEEKPADLYRPVFVAAMPPDSAMADALVMKGGARQITKREQKRTRRVLRRKLRALTRAKLR